MFGTKCLLACVQGLDLADASPVGTRQKPGENVKLFFPLESSAAERKLTACGDVTRLGYGYQCSLHQTSTDVGCHKKEICFPSMLWIEPRFPEKHVNVLRSVKLDWYVGK